MLSKSNKKWLKIAPRPRDNSQQRKSRRVELLSRKGLLPSNIKDDELASIHFQREFRSRFGSMCPRFFTGSLQNAVNQACGKGLDDERLLAIYLHNDGSLNSDRFCIQQLCTDVTLDILDKRFVTWAWDVTEESNKQRFLGKASNYLDRGTLYDVTRAHKDRYPMVLILRCRDNRCRVEKRLEGNTNTEEFVAALSEQVVFAEQARKIVKENDKQRAIRNSILEQQKKEFEESLKADQEKAKKRQEESRLKKMNKVNANKLRELEIKEQRKLKAESSKMKSSLRKEPNHSRNVSSAEIV
uniref:FAS-associated factor 1-like n=1 Tax=Styela clava TaxID=7725 RepID=UPI0019396C46|nr:FAS-associated factor 1-like [Styela clava]